MDVKKILEPLFRSGFDPLSPHCWSHTPQRSQRLNGIISAISAFHNDGGEASEIISAVAEGLKHRYENPTEALLSLTLAKLALERLDVGYQVDAKEELEALEAQIHRSERRLP